jgi:hypothetical protein
MNDANAEQGVLKSYGEQSFKLLKSVASLYDPEEVFQKQQNKGFLLSREL